MTISFHPRAHFARIKHFSTRAVAALAAAVMAGLASPATAAEATAPEIVVSASRVPLPARETGSAVTVISGQMLEDRQVRFVSDVLREVPGVAVSRSGPTGSFTQLRIRGAEGNQTLVLIDGIEVNNPAGGSEYDLSSLLALQVERIEVLRGPQSALYGSDAMGGVVNIVTRRPEKGWSASAVGESGTAATWTGSAQLGYGHSRFHLSGGVSRFTTNGISEADADNGNGEADPFETTGFNFKLGARPAKDLELEVIGFVIDSERATDDQVAVVNIEDGFGHEERAQRHGLAKAKWSLFDGGWEHILRAALTKDEAGFFDAGSAKTFTSNGRKTKFDYQTNVLFKTDGSARAEHTVTFAAEQESDEQFTDSAFSGPNKKTVENYGYVGEYRVGLWDSLFVSASLRFDDNDALFSDELTWRGTLAYIVDPWNMRFHGAIGRGVKNPTLFELFGSTPTFTGNPDLTPEENVGWDAGAERGFFADRLIVDITYFSNRFENFISGAGNTATNVPGTTKTRGLEVTVVAEPVPGLKIDGSYTFTETKDRDGTELVRRPRHMASLNSTYRFSVAGHEATANLGVRHNGDQRDQVFDSFFPAVTRIEVLEAFTLVNAGAAFKLGYGAELFARVENLLDENYQEVFGFGAQGIAAFAGLRIALGGGGSGSARGGGR